MSKTTILKALALIIPAACATALHAQTRLPAFDSRVNPELVGKAASNGMLNDGRWPSSWIVSEGADNAYGVYMFRKTIELPAVPVTYIVNVSADNRYKLYVNGSLVNAGPAKGDAFNWNFDTLDLAPYLHSGSNVISAVVWNFAEHRPVAIMSMGQPGFLVQGNGAAEQEINTDGSWKAMRCMAYSPEAVKVRGYYAAGCCDRMDSSEYPWGWQEEGYDDSAWSPAVKITNAASKGARDYRYWQLVPRPIPLMEVKQIGSDNLGAMTVPAWDGVEIVLDAKALMTGYPRIRFSGGKGAEIRLSYAEAFYEGPGYQKGNRNETMGKQFIGYSDVIIADGGERREFEPLWWRTWRYLRVSVKAMAEPLVIEGIDACSSMYPFERVSSFVAKGNTDLNRMLAIGWHTARLCAHETYMDCPYYEQLQYFGDSRIQALVTLYNTRDSCMVRNLIEQGRQSMTADGLTMSRYPTHIMQIIPPYSLIWVNTCHDLWMYRGEEKYLATLLPAMRSVFRYFGSYLDDGKLLSNVPYWNFADWAGLKSGLLPFDSRGRCAYMDLLHILALRDAAEMERGFGDTNVAKEYEALAQKIAASVKAAYWDGARSLFADNGAKDSYSQHVNALAILADILPADQSAALMRRIMEDKSLRQCTIYFRFYLQMAMAHSGLGDMLLDNLDVLKDQMKLGLTTWAEMPEPSRSDCHAWGASPNIEFYRMVLGIDSAAPGFKKVRIAPTPGYLKEVQGGIPTPDGEIYVSYRIADSGRMSAEVTLPAGVSGSFVWHGRSRSLKAGKNWINMK